MQIALALSDALSVADSTIALAKFRLMPKIKTVEHVVSVYFVSVKSVLDSLSAVVFDWPSRVPTPKMKYDGPSCLIALNK